MKILATSILTGYLLIASVKDIINRRISRLYLTAGIIPVIACIWARLHMISQDSLIIGILISHAVGALIGGIFILVSHLTGEKLGKGDAMIFCICGAAAGYEILAVIIISAFMLGALYAVAMLAMGRFTKKSSFAFIPFILLGYLMAEILTGGL